MRIVDEPLLNYFRHKRACEYCGNDRAPGFDPHHVFCKGMGSGGRLDVCLNLLALCRNCHQAFHDGHTPRHKFIEIIAYREGLEPDQVVAAIWTLRRRERAA